jgi:hypothetical protein
MDADSIDPGGIAVRLRLLFTLFLALLFVLPLIACGDDDDDDDNDAAADDDDDATPGDDDDDTTPGDDDDDDDDDDDNDDDDDSTPPLPNELIDEGKRWLALGDGDRANLYFRQALEQVPDHPEANYGIVMGNNLHMFDILSILIDYIESLAYGGPVGKATDPDNILDSFLEEMFDGFLYTAAREQTEFVAICLENGYEFTQTDEIPIILHFELEAELAGQFDDAELHGSSVLTGALWSLISQLDAVSLDVDISLLASVIEIDFDDLVPALTELVGVLLSAFEDPSYPDFLTLPPENVPQLQEAALMLAFSMDEFNNMFDAIDAEGGDQTTDVVGYDDANGNLEFDAGEPYRFPTLGALDEDEMALLGRLRTSALALRDSLWDYTEFDTDPENLQPFNLSYLNPVLELFELPPLIPNLTFLDIDLGGVYDDPGEDGLKQTVLTILRLAEIILGLIGTPVA